MKLQKLQKYNIDRDYQLLALMSVTIHDEKAIRVSNAMLNRVNFLRVEDDIVAEKLTIPGYGGYNIDLYIYKPRNSVRDIPCMVYFHGGGFFFKGDALSPKILSEYIRNTNVMIVYVDYRLSIDYPFPTPIEDCYAGLKWTFENYEYLGIDQNKIFVMGFSAGGALAAGVTLMARDRGFNAIRAQILICPVTDHRQLTHSVQTFTDTPNWNSSSNKHMWELYLRNLKGEIPCYASPAIAKSLKGLPPAYVEVSEFDPLHDEGLIYAQNLRNDGVHVVINDTVGTIHMSSIVLKAKKTVDSINKMSKFINDIIKS